MLKQHLKISVRKLKLGNKWVFQMNKDPKHTSKVVAKWLKRTTKSRYWSGHHQALTSILLKICGQNWKNVCEQGGLQTRLSYTSSVRRNGPKFTQLIMGRLWKATWNVWPKLNYLKGNATKYTQLVCKLLTHWECDERNKSRNKSISLLLFWHFTFLK